MSEHGFLHAVYTGHILQNPSNSVSCGEEILVSWQSCNRRRVSGRLLGDIRNYFVCAPHPQQHNKRHSIFQRPFARRAQCLSGRVATENTLRDLTIAARFHSRLTKPRRKPQLTLQTMWAEKRAFSVDAASTVPRGTLIPEERCARIASVGGRIVGGSGLDQRRDPDFLFRPPSPRRSSAFFLLFLQIFRIPKVESPIQSHSFLIVWCCYRTVCGTNIPKSKSKGEIK
ncbi:hypothetical protein CDAR_78701 [Caerostris darwini]|uniref:Uncharacterized protein n=1 Tax=Caerostris darwini TaxID=1538125 RepID=A0AAV4QU68_9ARAC|nr:hypothetical protein CDAR_78701 [Caerostris darwini]